MLLKTDKSPAVACAGASRLPLQPPRLSIRSLAAATIFLPLFAATYCGAYLLRFAGDDHALYNWWLRKGYSVAHDSMILLSQMFANVREQIISQQDAHIRELSTPIMPLYHGILALPLVGAFDAHRAGQVMETLLSGISQQQADVVIIDITGVPMVDTNVANYLLMAARAARLLGAQIILVGISAEIAQTLVQLGADLTGMATRANLQSGIEYALAMQGLAIAPRS